jgi:hypothetical protein
MKTVITQQAKLLAEQVMHRVEKDLLAKIAASGQPSEAPVR